MSTFREKLGARFVDYYNDPNRGDTDGDAFMAGAREALQLAADEAEALSERMIAWDGELKTVAAAQHLTTAQRLRARADELR